MTLRREALLTLTLIFGTLGTAQSPGEVLARSVSYLRAQGLLKDRLATQNPTQLAGFPNPQPKELPPQDLNTEDPNTFVLKSAKNSRMKGDVIEATGDVRFAFRGYEVIADRVHGDVKSQIFTLIGNVVLIGEGQIVHGERIVVNLKDKTFAISHGRSQLAPSFLGPQLQGDIYIRGEQISGTQHRIEGKNSLLTTCPLDHPHFEFRSESSVVRPSRRAILRNVSVIVLGKKLITIPYISVPLERYSERYLPEVGQSRDEGYFIKTKFTTPLPGDDYFDTRLDYYTKLGMGLGGAYYYANSAMQGNAKLFGITGRPRSIIASLEHLQGLWGGRLSVGTDYQKNNYLTAPNAITLSNRLNFFHSDKSGSNFRLSAFRVESTSGTFRSESNSFSFGDTRNWNRFFTTNADINYSSSSSRAQGNESINREQVDTRFRGAYTANFGLTELEYFRIIPIQKQEAFFGSGSRTPVLTFRSDLGKLVSKKLQRAVPLGIEAAWGEYGEAGLRKTRVGLDFKLNRNDGGSSRHSLSTQARLRQTFYNDDTAQYLMNLGLYYRYALGGDTSLNVRYTYLRPEGFTPLSLDVSGQYHVANVDVSVRPFRSLQLSAQSGYDFLIVKQQRIPWQSATFRSEWRPNERVLLQATSFYDHTRHNFASNRLDFGWNIAGGLISAGLRYDGDRHTWGNVDIFANGLTWGKLKTSIVFSYNGFTKRPEARHLSLTYDLHCAEAILQILDNPTGFRPGTQIGFFVRIKALPFNTPFGTGNRGQFIGGSPTRL